MKNENKQPLTLLHLNSSNCLTVAEIESKLVTRAYYHDNRMFVNASATFLKISFSLQKFVNGSRDGDVTFLRYVHHVY